MKKVKLINRSTNSIPTYATANAAGMDLRAFIKEEKILLPGSIALIGTGLYIELPEGLEAQVRPRSGLALNHGITVLNSPGTIDADYRGEIGVILKNHGDKGFVIRSGDRIAQLVIAKYERVEFEESEVISETVRGEGGFGHTGYK